MPSPRLRSSLFGVVAVTALLAGGLLSAPAANAASTPGKITFSPANGKGATLTDFITDGVCPDVNDNLVVYVTGGSGAGDLGTNIQKNIVSAGQPSTEGPGYHIVAERTWTDFAKQGDPAISALNGTYTVTASCVSSDQTFVGQLTFTSGASLDASTYISGAGIHNQTKPSITGAGAKGAPAGAVLTANPGTWDVAGVTFKYQWKVAGMPVSGQTNTTYTIQPSDVGQQITVSVTASKSGYSDVSAESDPVNVLDTMTAQKAPAISGVVAVGSTLTVSDPVWSANAVDNAYQWTSNGMPIAGATQNTYKLTAADKGKTIAVTVTGSTDGYADANVSAPGIIWNTVAPKITGKAKVGQTLKVTSGTWSAAGLKYTYKWTRNGVAIKGATKTSYKLVAADKGKKVAVTVTATKVGLRTATANSAALKVS